MSENPYSKYAAIGLVLVVLVAGFALSGCKQQAANPSSSMGGASTSAEASRPSSNDMVILDAEGAFEVALDYSAGTGFEWQCRVEPEGPFFIARQSTKDLAEDSDEPITGGPLQDIVMVRAAEDGKATLVCELVRPWEEGVEPMEVQSFTFEVDSDLSMRFVPEESSYLIEPEEVFNS